ncbi:MAG: nucleoside-diphosphate kinase, partial [Candidatus Pacebacteria bacterium]|nr:nucleoside-diphosphate kinase [Candidatus Paceibacterota bacterium]
MNNLQQTLIVFKPDAIQRGIVGEVLSRFEKMGLKIVGMKMLNPDEQHYYHHYET